MHAATIDEVAARQGEDAFILQIRPPARIQAEELATALDAFLGVYLAQTGPEAGRFAPLGALTWAITTPLEDIASVDDLAAGLAEAVFGDPLSEAVLLARPDELPLADAPDGAQGEVEPPIDPALDVELGEDIVLVGDLTSESEAAEPARDEAGADDDAWTVNELSDALADAPTEFEADADHEADLGADVDADGEADISTDPEAPIEFGPDEEGDLDDTWDIAEPAARGGDLPDPALAEPASSALEPPEPEPPQPEMEEPATIASELAAFRSEMQTIARSIPGVGDADGVLAAFRTELEEVAGSMGQRADSAAQRIESAADRVIEAASAADAARIDALVERAERSTEVMETSVHNALSVLVRACEAMGETVEPPAEPTEQG